MQFDLRDLRSAGAQFGSAIGLFERAKLELDSPPTPVNETGLLGGQFRVVENVGHQVDLAATVVEAEQTQHQRRLLLPHRRIGPAVDDVAPLPNHPQAFEQPNIAADADQEAVTLIEDRPPEIIADKASIGTKQREFNGNRSSSSSISTWPRSLEYDGPSFQHQGSRKPMCHRSVNHICGPTAWGS